MRRILMIGVLGLSLVFMSADALAFSAFKGRFGDPWCTQSEDTVLWQMSDYLGPGSVNVSTKSGGGSVRIRANAGVLEIPRPTVVTVRSKSRGVSGYHWVVPVLAFSGKSTFLPKLSGAYWNSYYRHHSGPWSGSFRVALNPGEYTIGLGHHCRGAPDWHCGGSSVKFNYINISFKECF